MAYAHLTKEERYQVRALLDANWTIEKLPEFWGVVRTRSRGSCPIIVVCEVIDPARQIGSPASARLPADAGTESPRANGPKSVG